MNTYLMNKEIRPETKARLEMAHTWLLKLDDPDVTQQTLDEFERWIKESPRNKDIFDQAVTLRDAFLCLDDDDFDIQVHAPTLAEKLTDFTDYLSSLFSYHKWQIASFSLAAFFVLLSVITLLSNPDVTTEPEVMVSTNTYETGIGETEEFLLSDGTSMTVGAASKVNAIFREGTRTVELVAGSVYVDVARDAHRPFSVKTGNLTVTALGTAFDVQQSPHQHRVSVAEGKVEVFYDVSMQDIPISKTTKTQLYAGQAITADRTTKLKQVFTVNTQDVGAWRNGILIYKGDVLADVIADASRYSVKPIVIDSNSKNIGKLQLRGVFQGTDIDRLLDTIALTHEIEVDRSDDKQIIIRKK